MKALFCALFAVLLAGCAVPVRETVVKEVRTENGQTITTTTTRTNAPVVIPACYVDAWGRCLPYPTYVPYYGYGPVVRFNFWVGGHRHWH